jgi:uncharacterized membrane protein
MVAALAGAGFLVRASVGSPFRRHVELTKTFTIAAPVEQVFAFFTEVENLPRIMQHVRSVRRTADRRSHWVVEGPAGIPIQWDAEVTRLVPNELFAWKTTSGGGMVRHTGLVRFERTDHATRVSIRVCYDPIGGLLGEAIATLLGANPKRALDEDMLRLKSLLERGKTFAHGHEVWRGESV